MAPHVISLLPLLSMCGQSRGVAVGGGRSSHLLASTRLAPVAGGGKEQRAEVGEKRSTRRRLGRRAGEKRSGVGSWAEQRGGVDGPRRSAAGGVGWADEKDVAAVTLLGQERNNRIEREKRCERWPTREEWRAGFGQ